MNVLAPNGPLPLPQTRCPLCGGPNGCIPAQTGSFQEACWCTEVSFSEELLRRVPAAEAGRSCLCRKCAQSAA